MNLIKSSRSASLFLVKPCSLSQPKYISFFRKKKKSSQELAEEEVLVDENQAEETSRWSHLSEEEINKICDKSGLDDELKAIETGIAKPRKFTLLDEYKRDFIRPLYGMYGKATGLKPGVCWPTKEELDFIKKFEQTFYPSLSKLLEDLKLQKEQELQALKQREKEVIKNLKELPKLKKEFYEKLEIKRLEIEEEKKKHQKLIQEIREYVGFDIDPKDERFQEAVAQKEEEEKAKLKASQKKDKHAKITQMLQKMLDLPEETDLGNKPLVTPKKDKS